MGNTVGIGNFLEKLSRGDSDANLHFEDLCHFLQTKGFRMRVSGNHHIFTRTGVRERINIQRDGQHAKPYQIREIRRILARHELL